MAIIVTYPSALEYWLLEKGIPRPFDYGFFKESGNTSAVLSGRFNRNELLQAPEQLNFNLPLHIAVPENTMRNGNENLKIHILPKRLPEDCFIAVAKGVYVCSPELCFLFAARELDVPELILLGNELCAIYKRDQYADYGQSRREPLMTRDSVTAFLQQMRGVSGKKKADIAARYILDRANSPMESRLAVIAALPVYLGGYGIRNTKLNYEVFLSKQGEDFLGRKSCCCDMVWIEEKVVLEYDSNLTHLQIGQHFLDKKRSTALTLSGFKVISLTAEQVGQFRTIENTFLSLRSALGMKNHSSRFAETFADRWDVVHKIMFSDPVYDLLSKGAEL